MSSMDLDEQVMVVDAFVLVWILLCTRNGVGMGAAASGDKISDAVVFMAFVVVNMSVEDDDSRPHLFLPFLQ